MLRGVPVHAATDQDERITQALGALCGSAGTCSGGQQELDHNRMTNVPTEQNRMTYYYYYTHTTKTGMMTYPVWAYLTNHDQDPFLSVYQLHSWSLIPIITNIVVSALGFVVFALPQLKGFITRNYR